MEIEQFKKEILPFREPLLRYARSVLADPVEAEDVVQEVFLKLWSIRSDLAQYRNPLALGIRITRNLSMNRIKSKKKTILRIEKYPLASPGSSPYAQLEEKDCVGYVQELIGLLPPTQQAILRMRHLDGYEVEEIAEITGSSPGAIRMNLSRSRKKIRDVFFKTNVK